MTRVRAVRRLVLGALVAAAALPVPASAQDAPPSARRALSVVRTVSARFPLAAWKVVDVDGDGADDLLAVGRGGEVRVWRGATGLPAEEPSGVLVLPEPERSVLSIADVLRNGGPPQLAVLSRRGLEVYPVGPEGAYVRAPVLVAPQTAIPFRVGQPTFAPVLRDVNGDGGPDLILPCAETCELWLWTPPAKDAGAGALPTYRSVGAFKVSVSRERSADAELLSDVLESSFRVPGLRFQDVNGDGRDDLVVEDGKTRAFHLAKADGTISSDPDVRVDLSKFEDTTPGADVRLGRTLAGGDDQKMESTDLDGDGIPDYVISHRRKVWVFLGTRDGPQFTEPSHTLKVADDVSAMLVARLDSDPRPDLLLLRVQVPTVATILKGLVTSWDVDVSAVGYENAGGGKFATSPKWKGDVALRLPAILGVLKDPDALVRRFEGLGAKFSRGFLWGDFDGDGHEDAAVAAGSERRLDVWFGVPRDGAGGAGTDGGGAGSDGEGDADLGSVFFGEERVWDLDRVLRWLGDFADRRFAQVTGNREPSQRIALRGEGDADYEGAAAGRFGGGGAAGGAARAGAIVVAYTDGEGRGVFDVWR